MTEKKRLSRSSLRVMNILIHKSELYGNNFFYPYKLLSAELNYSEKTIQRIASNLKEEGFIDYVIGRGWNTETRWTICEKTHEMSTEMNINTPLKNPLIYYGGKQMMLKKILPLKTF